MLPLINIQFRIAFRRSIFRLLRDAHIDANDHEYWPMYWGFSATLEDICTLLSNDDVRRIRDSEPANLTTLGRVLMRHVIDVVNNNSFPADLRLYQECRSCLLILSKLIPIIYELPDEKLEIDIFWQNVGEDGDGLGLSLIRVLHSLLFMPGFTIPASSSGSQVWYVIPGLHLQQLTCIGLLASAAIPVCNQISALLKTES